MSSICWILLIGGWRNPREQLLFTIPAQRETRVLLQSQAALASLCLPSTSGFERILSMCALIFLRKGKSLSGKKKGLVKRSKPPPVQTQDKACQAVSLEIRECTKHANRKNPQGKNAQTSAGTASCVCREGRGGKVIKGRRPSSDDSRASSYEVSLSLIVLQNLELHKLFGDWICSRALLLTQGVQIIEWKLLGKPICEIRQPALVILWWKKIIFRYCVCFCGKWPEYGWGSNAKSCPLQVLVLESVSLRALILQEVGITCLTLQNCPHLHCLTS